MTKLYFNKEDVVGYLEMKLQDNTASVDEQYLYELYIWTGEVKNNYTHKRLIAEMKRIYLGS